MTIKLLATTAGVSTRTVQRRIEVFNKEHNTTHSSGENSEITDQELLKFLMLEFDIEGNKKEPDIEEKKKEKKKPASDLQTKLSSDWLIIAVMVVILWCDMFAFGAIGQNQFSHISKFAGFLFAIIGLATGIGSVVTYNRIKNETTAEAWKYIFALLQFSVFALVINQKFFFAELVMTSMFVAVFVGVQRSIKK